MKDATTKILTGVLILLFGITIRGYGIKADKANDRAEKAHEMASQAVIKTVLIENNMSHLQIAQNTMISDQRSFRSEVREDFKKLFIKISG